MLKSEHSCAFLCVKRVSSLPRYMGYAFYLLLPPSLDCKQDRKWKYDEHRISDEVADLCMKWLANTPDVVLCYKICPYRR